MSLLDDEQMFLWINFNYSKKHLFFSTSGDFQGKWLEKFSLEGPKAMRQPMSRDKIMFVQFKTMCVIDWIRKNSFRFRSSIERRSSNLHHLSSMYSLDPRSCSRIDWVIIEDHEAFNLKIVWDKLWFVKFACQTWLKKQSHTK